MSDLDAQPGTGEARVLAAIARAEAVHAEVATATPQIPSAWVDEAVEAWHAASADPRGLLLDDVLRLVLAHVVVAHIDTAAVRLARRENLRMRALRAEAAAARVRGQHAVYNAWRPATMWQRLRHAWARG